MNLKKTLLPMSVIAMAFAGSIALVGAQPAATAVPTKLAIVNPARIFNEMAETKDLKVKLETEGKNLQETERTKRQRLQQLQDERNILKSDSTQFADKSRELTQAAIEFRAWGEISQQELQRNQRQQMKLLFDKIQAATAQIAIQRGYDVILADQRPDLPDNLDQLTVEEVRSRIIQRNVLYAVPNIDLSSDVIAQLDADYKSKK